MKKPLKILMFFIVFTIIATNLLSCNKSDDKSGNNVISEICKGEMLLGFNNYEELRFKKWSMHFGRGELNTDRNYITEGEGSLHLELQGEQPSVNAIPEFVIDCTTENFSTNNLSKANGIVFDVYNDNETSIRIRMAISATVVGDYSIAPVKEFFLTPKAWNRCKYDLSDGALRSAFNNLTDITEIIFFFPDYQNEGGEKYSVYIDNLSALMSNTVAEYKIDKNDGIILDFENVGEVSLLYTDLIFFDHHFCPVLTVNSDKNFVTSGERSLKWMVEMPKYGYNKLNDYSIEQGFHLTMENAEIIGENAKSITFDIINANPSEEQILVGYRLISGDKEDTHYIKPYEKYTVSITDDDINTISLLTIRHRLNYTYDLGYNKTFYIDNVKVNY